MNKAMCTSMRMACFSRYVGNYAGWPWIFGFPRKPLNKSSGSLVTLLVHRVVAGVF